MMNYNYGKDKHKNWIVEETQFNDKYLGKCEAIMAQGNGYMGMRTALEEPYLNETRNMFVAGTFNKADDTEVTELPNAADLSQINFNFNDQPFSLMQGRIIEYSRRLNLKNGEVVRNVVWESPNKDQLKLEFKKVVSFDNNHIIAQAITVKALNSDVELELESGINGQMSNSGAQHFKEGVRRLYDKTFLHLVQTTNESGLDFVLNTAHRFTKNNQTIDLDSYIKMERRMITYEFKHLLKKGETIKLEKISNVFTSRDKQFDNENYDLETLRNHSLANIKEYYEIGYDKILEASERVWNEKVWNNYPITIDSANDYYQLAIRFALYHLHIMTPAHDNRMNIGAKGFSGEGYKGHTFWDTEIFMLPFWNFTNPTVARSLVEYRYNTLSGAHKKAKDNGYEGAQYPWESAWLNDGEVTPVWGAADIVTGKSTKIWSGFIEQHITSDVALGVWQYANVSNDIEFMDKYGYEILIDTAKFWASRLEWNEEKQEYHINNVIGPDEYKEHKNNNAFTNYSAHWSMKNAIEYIDFLQQSKPEIYNRLDEKLNLKDTYQKLTDKLHKVYLPQPREDRVIPQDDTYLSLKEIDLTKYKNQKHVGTLFRDYNLSQVNQIQVSKQADLLILFLLLEDLFDEETKLANFNYYESRTLHDSSLSLSTHTILANDLGEYDMAYDLFNRAVNIDLGPNMKTSDHGIHAASIGGIWQSVVLGFGGVRLTGGHLRVNPKLPKDWNKLDFYIMWHGDKLHIEINQKTLKLTNLTKTNKQVRFEHNHEMHTLVDQIELPL